MPACESYFNRIYDETYAALLKHVIARTSRAADVEDVLQEVYRKFYTRIRRKGFADIENPKAFLLTAANKELSRYYAARQKRREREAPLQESLAPETPFAQGLDRAEAVAAVWEAVKSLPPDSYRAFALYYGFDMPVEAVAHALGVSAEAVKSRLFRARNAVRGRLKGEQP